MDFLTALRISGSGLSVERTRVNLASSNLANAETTRTAAGGPYKRLDPVIQAMPFAPALGEASAPTPAIESGDLVDRRRQRARGGRSTAPATPTPMPEGFVTFPNVNPVHEVVNLMSASRSYEANATAIETLKTMAQRGLDIAR